MSEAVARRTEVTGVYISTMIACFIGASLGWWDAVAIAFGYLGGRLAYLLNGRIPWLGDPDEEDEDDQRT